MQPEALVHPRERKPDAPTVLIVDDDFDVINLLDMSFRRFNAPFNVEWALSGEAAMSAVEARCFDLLIIDVDLPDVTGVAAGVTIHEYDEGLPIIIHTGYPQIVVEPYLQKINAEYIQKGTIEPEAFVEKIREKCASRRCKESKGRHTAHPRPDGSGELKLPRGWRESVSRFNVTFMGRIR